MSRSRINSPAAQIDASPLITGVAPLPVFHRGIGERNQRVKNDRTAGRPRQGCQDQHIHLADVARSPRRPHQAALGSAGCQSSHRPWRAAGRAGATIPAADSSRSYRGRAPRPAHAAPGRRTRPGRARRSSVRCAGSPAHRFRRRECGCSVPVLNSSQPGLPVGISRLPLPNGREANPVPFPWSHVTGRGAPRPVT
jgi:hypothetical protein